MNPVKQLNPKQLRFCQEYVIDLNGTQAAIRAGYSEKTAASIANENLTKPEIQNKIQQLQSAIAEQKQVSAEWVLNRFIEISNRCMTAVPVMDFDREERVMVQRTTETEDGQVVGVFEFDASGATKATEMIAKHIGFFERDNKQRTDLTINAFLSDIKKLSDADLDKIIYQLESKTKK